jgi:hypothetical protein
MRERDAEHANEFGVPEGSFSKGNGGAPRHDPG